MGEAVPILSGAFLGAVLAFAGPAYRGKAAVLAIILSVCATVGSGEFRASWGYLIADVVLVLAGATASFLTARAWRKLLRD